MASQLFQDYCFWSHGFVLHRKFDAFGTSSHGEGNRYQKIFFATLISTSGRFNRENKKICHTVLCKSNANDNRQISRFVLAISRRYISETSHELPNVKTINHRDIGTIFAISRRDIVLATLRCNDISQSKRYITTIYRCSEVRCNDMS